MSSSIYHIAPNFCGTLFLWILWFDFWSRKFSSQKFSMLMVGVAMCCAVQRALADSEHWHVHACTCNVLSQQRITKVRSLPYVSLLRRASRRIESLWRKTRIRNSSALFRFISLHTYKPQCHVYELWAERQRELSAQASWRGGNHKKLSDHEIFIMKIYIHVIFGNFTKILNHENLELYSIFFNFDYISTC